MREHDPATDDARQPARVLGALAMELAPGAYAIDGLSQAQTGELATWIARDLADFAADAAMLELVTVGAHYDAVELLRPGWPVHHQLGQLAARAPQQPASGGRIIAFGAHDGHLPDALTPASDYNGGPLRLLPFVLNGETAAVTGVNAIFERDLLERGMAGAATALAAQEMFGLRIKHARYLTLHDLAAMMALQYDHAGIAPLWPIIETALLAPDAHAWLDAPPEPLVHYADREARIALLSPTAWRARYAAASLEDSAVLARRYAHFEARQRQFAAVLGAHAVPVTFAHCARGEKAEL